MRKMWLSSATVSISAFAEVRGGLSKCLLCAVKLTLLVLCLTSALRCGFNQSMQHVNLLVKEGVLQPWLVNPVYITPPN